MNTWNIYGLDDIDEEDALDEDEYPHKFYPHKCKRCKGICKYDEDGYLVDEEEIEDWEEDDDLDEAVP